MNFSSDDGSNVTGPPMELNSLLTTTQYVLLVFFSIVCYYIALIISALAVGESTSTFLLPFTIVKSLIEGCTKAAVKIVQRRRRQRIFVGVDYEDNDGAIDIFDRTNRPSQNIE